MIATAGLRSNEWSNGDRGTRNARGIAGGSGLGGFGFGDFEGLRGFRESLLGSVGSGGKSRGHCASGMMWNESGGVGYVILCNVEG